MRFQPSDVPVTDPFFAAVRRRHPDADLVILPAELPPGRAEGATEADVESSLARVADRCEDLWSAIAPQADGTPQTRPAFGDDQDSVRATARVVSRRTDGFEVLVGLRHELERHGWAVRRPDGPVERLTAALDDLDLVASYSDQGGVLILVLTGPSLPVGRRRARVLVRSGAGDR